jgi:hypothetical protein
LAATRNALFLSAFLAASTFRPLHAMDKIELSGGVQMGYNLGQNGQGWPKLWEDPLANQNRGGFYLRNLRAMAVFPFDSTFSGVIVGNLAFASVDEAYLQKRWGAYVLKAGKFRGAGLRSGSGIDEFERITIRPQYYANLWEDNKRLTAFRDLGIQGERTFLDGSLTAKLFFHNANGQNVLLDEPSNGSGSSTQALGIDYEMDYRVSRFTLIGGHAGARGNREWSEFAGSHGFWRADYWFKTNPLVDFSAFHQMDFPRFHLFSEAMLLYDRTTRVLPDSTALKSWGVSTMARFDAGRRWSPFLRYEFTDPTDGLVNDDALHIATLGTIFLPSPENHPALKLTGEYVRVLEEGGRNRYGNDVLYVQLQTVF